MQPTQNTVLITGGTSGIGLALAGRFAHNDNTVIVT
jgi:short-subunit dehydrogenase involved in D-alanine esterification of teichoic acids